MDEETALRTQDLPRPTESTPVERIPRAAADARRCDVSRRRRRWFVLGRFVSVVGDVLARPPRRHPKCFVRAAAVACAALVIAVASAQASSPYRLYMETDGYVRGCYTAWTFWRSTASGLLIHTSPSETLSSLVVSASGRQLAYASGYQDYRGAQIKVVDIGRPGSAGRVTTLSGQPGDLGLTPLAISPHGRYVLAKTAAGFPPAARYYLFAHGRRLRTFPAYPSFDIGEAAWSARGALVVANYDAPQRRLALMSLSGKLSKLKLRTDDLGGPAWTADGKHLLLTINHNVVSVRPDAHDRHTLARNAYFPAASPDGRHLAFRRYIPYGGKIPRGGAAFIVADANGRHQRRMRESPQGNLDQLAWGLPTSLPSNSLPPPTDGGNCS
jgi:WD40 repeat protein